jgi:hypothetical protein
MNAKRLLSAVLFMSLVCSIFASAKALTPPSATAKSRTAVSQPSPQSAQQLAGGVEPVPLCEPDVKVCDSLPPQYPPKAISQGQMTIAGGVEPVPLCEPDVKVCDSLPPQYPPKATFAEMAL